MIEPTEKTLIRHPQGTTHKIFPFNLKMTKKDFHLYFYIIEDLGET